MRTDFRAIPKGDKQLSQFIEVLEWVDNVGNDMVHRVPLDGTGEIKFGAQLIVNESQAAVFFRDGRALDILGRDGTPSPPRTFLY